MATATDMVEERDLLAETGLADQLGFLLRFAHAAVWSDLIETLQPFGLRPAHYSALLIVRVAPGCRQQAIGDALGIQRPNLVAMIDGLVKRGVIRRDPHPDDRRSHALHLTSAGESLLVEAERAHGAHEARLMALLPNEEGRAVLGSALRRLARMAGDAPV